MPSAWASDVNLSRLFLSFDAKLRVSGYTFDIVRWGERVWVVVTQSGNMHRGRNQEEKQASLLYWHKCISNKSSTKAL